MSILCTLFLSEQYMNASAATDSFGLQYLFFFSLNMVECVLRTVLYVTLPRAVQKRGENALFVWLTAAVCL